MKLPGLRTLESIYGETSRSLARYESLARNFEKNFASDVMEFFTAPGRTEIVGNHTDHNGGKILAGSISLDTIGAAYPNGTDIIIIVSEGYRDRIIVDLTKPDLVPKNFGSVSLVRGMAQAVQGMGFNISGFNAYVSTEVISAAGVASSASFEMLICSIINYFFNDNKMHFIDYARIGQYAENHFWDKASGLMDQMACAVGGTILLDFSQISKSDSPDVHIAEQALYRRVDFSFSQIGYDLVIVNTGKGHADLSEEYSGIPAEMKEVAKALGVNLLCETDEETLLDNIQKIGNDRAILRALHFFRENARVDEACQACRNGDKDSMIRIIDESGRSSWELLQNCYSTGNYKEQKVALALALTQGFLSHTKKGACRVHGGGFAGVIACILPQEETSDYVKYIGRFVGRKNVYPMDIRSFGAGRVE